MQKTKKVNCAIVFDKKQLFDITQCLDCLLGPKGLAFRLKERKTQDSDRRVIDLNCIEVLLVWSEDKGNGLKKIIGKKIIGVSKTIERIDGGTMRTGNKDVPIWEYGKLINPSKKAKRSKFDFSFFHYDVLKILFEQKFYSGIMLGGISARLGKIPFSSGGKVVGKTFTFKMEPCNVIEPIMDEDLGLPAYDLGLSCPPSWDPSKNKDGKKPFIISSLLKFSKQISKIK